MRAHPLTGDVIANGGHALNPRGELYATETMQERLVLRNWLDELRGTGVRTGGPDAKTIVGRLQHATIPIDPVRWLLEEGMMAQRTNKPYRSGELEIILSLSPTRENIYWLAMLLERSEKAIQIVYKHAFEHGPFGADARVQGQKILSAKKRIGIAIGRQREVRQAKKQMA